MITHEMIQNLPPHVKPEAEFALISLTRSGFWEFAERELAKKVLRSFHQTDDSALLADIRMTQAFIKATRTMQEVGARLYQEKKA